MSERHDKNDQRLPRNTFFIHDSSQTLHLREQTAWDSCLKAWRISVKSQRQILYEASSTRDRETLEDERMEMFCFTWESQRDMRRQDDAWVTERKACEATSDTWWRKCCKNNWKRSWWGWRRKGMKSIPSIEGKNWRQDWKSVSLPLFHQDKENPSEGPSMSLLPFIPASLDDFLVSLLSLNLPLRWVLTFENIYLFAVRYNLMIYKYYTSKFALLYAHS